MISFNNRFRPNQSKKRRLFNSKVNKIKSVNKILTKRGGVKL